MSCPWALAADLPQGRLGLVVDKGAGCQVRWSQNYERNIALSAYPRIAHLNSQGGESIATASSENTVSCKLSCDLAGVLIDRECVVLRNLAEAKAGNFRSRREKPDPLTALTEGPDQRLVAWHQRESESIRRGPGSSSSASQTFPLGQYRSDATSFCHDRTLIAIVIAYGVAPMRCSFPV